MLQVLNKRVIEGVIFLEFNGRKLDLHSERGNAK